MDSIFVKPGDKVSQGDVIGKINKSGNPFAKEDVPVYSPIDGIVAACPVSQGGAILGRGTPAATTLFTITSMTDTLLVSAPVGELDIGKIKEGLEARITFQAYPGRNFASQVKSRCSC
ncbi:MAG: efflux RND transporter periplasmic adaptor subunit [Treponema sp.]|nr:efflux RND transporter periplasmic adaptor subunit [Treponema sp.]